VSSSRVAALHGNNADTPSAAQARIIAGALDLFGRHGVGGRSFQTIAELIRRIRARDQGASPWTPA
jgi:AcrR family transcriptional regulator